MTPDPATRPRRDRATLVTYGQIGLYGWFLYAFGPSITLQRDDQGTSNAVASLHGTLFAVGGVCVALLGPRIGIRLGRGRALRVGGSLMALGMVVYCSGLPTGATLLGALLAGVGGGCIVVFANAHLNAHQGLAAPAALSEANLLGAIAGTVSPIALGIGVAVGWGWRAGLLVAAVGLLALELFRGPLRSFGDEEERADHGTVRLPPRFWWSVVTLACLVAVEYCLIVWSSEVLRERGGTAASVAALGVTAVVGGMAVGRAAGASLTRRVDTERLFQAVILLSLIGTVATWLSSWPPAMFATLFVTGVGLGLHWPLGIARSVRASGHHADVAVSRAVLITGLASGVAPFVVGALADRVGVVTAFLVVPVLLGVALVTARAFRVPADGLPATLAIDEF